MEHAFEIRIVCMATDQAAAELLALAAAHAASQGGGRIADVRRGHDEPFGNISSMDGSAHCHGCGGQGWFQDLVEEEHEADCPGRCARRPCEWHGYR